MTSPERELIAATRRRARAGPRDRAAIRDQQEAVRRARAAGMTQERAMDITGLSRQRINQIVRGEAFLALHRERMRARRSA